MAKDLKEHEEINLHMKKDTLVHILFMIIITAGITAMKKMSEVEHMKIPTWGFALFVFILLLIYYGVIKLFNEA